MGIYIESKINIIIIFILFYLYNNNSIKPQNILIDDTEDYLKIKIIDLENMIKINDNEDYLLESNISRIGT